ncbi:MAG: GlcNAc-transferase family protein [Candidatus Nanopelagicales bacterium]
METIFISIAAYQDPQLLDTMKSALDNSVYPDRIYFGVALQYYNKPDLSGFKNTKTISYDPDTRPGIVRVRHNISRLLYDSQSYYLQIDSHYTFAPGWDEELIKWFKHISSESGTDKIMLLPLEPYPDGIMTSKFKLQLEDSESGTLVVHPHPVNGKQKQYEDYHEICFARVGQIFFPGSYVDNVGFDPYSHTIQEISYFSYRTIMSGYRVFQLNKAILWQEDSEYYKAVWSGKDAEDTYRDPNRFKSGAVEDAIHTWHEMSLAWIYNDFSKYAVPNPAITPEKFWEMQGDLDGYKASKSYFDKLIYNNL